jgi:hypothetical protein
MPGFGPVLAAESSAPPAATSLSLKPRTGSPASPDSPPHPGTPAGSPATITGPGATTAGSSASSTSQDSRP